MLQYWLDFFNSSGFEPHGYCFLWTRPLLILYVVSDSLITLSYYSIPAALAYFVYKRSDLAFKGVFLMFSAFILACGTTHLMGVWTLWYPDYWLDGGIKGLTAGVSLFTAVMLWVLMPKALALPSSAQLAVTNEELQRQMAKRADAEKALRESEAILRGLFEYAPDAMIVVNQQGDITRVNTQAETMFGYDRAELLGQPVEILLPERFHARHVNHRLGYMAESRIRPMGADLELFGRRKNGIEFAVAIMLSPLTATDVGMVIAVVRDITEHKKAEAEQAQLASIVEFSDDAIISKDLEGLIVSWNRGAERLYGYTADEAKGKSITILVPPEQPNDVPGILEQMRRGEAVDHYETTRLRKDGQRINVSLTISPIKDKVGNVTGASIVARDITERKRFEQALREKNVELEKANLAKDNFLAGMSHELRTPLNAIIGFTGTLLMKLPGPLTAEQEKQLRTVQASAKHLLSLINDLLDLTKVESGKVELNFEPVVCRSVVQEIVTALRPLAQSKNLTFETSLPAQELVISTDRRTLKQILLNLTNNAVKFTEHGGVRLELTRRQMGPQKLIEFSLIDSGIGIRSEDQAKLFQAFVQLDSSAARRYEGTGLGLYLCRKLAGLIGGRIEFESTYGQGSRFTLVIPETMPKTD